MATKSLTFKKIEGITAGSAFTVNAYASDKTVSAIVYFENFGVDVNVTKFTPKIGSVTVGGQNWLSTEIIKITYEMGYVNTSGTFISLSRFPTSSENVSEKSGTVSSSVSLSATSTALFSYMYPYAAYKITVESTQNLVGCKVVMSNFQLSAEYTVAKTTLSLSAYPEEGGTVTGGGTYDSGSTITISATPNPGYVFKEWQTSTGDHTTLSTNATCSFKVLDYLYVQALFEYVGINKIYIGTSQPKKIYVGTQEVKAVYVGTTKVYG